MLYTYYLGYCQTCRWSGTCKFWKDDDAFSIRCFGIQRIEWGAKPSISCIIQYRR